MNINKEMKLQELLGAKLFKKIVLKLEEFKYKIIDKFFPNLTNFYNIILDNYSDKEINKYHSNTTKNKIINDVKREKLILRKEINNKLNRNYHYDGNIDELISYLNDNYNIHKKGLISNIIFIVLELLLFNYISSILFVVNNIFLIINFFSLLINFECMNLQKYNLNRINKSYNKLKKLEDRKRDRDIEKYSDIFVSISNTLSKSKDIPDYKEVNSNISDEDKDKLIEYLIEIKNERKEKVLEKRKVM